MTDNRSYLHRLVGLASPSHPAAEEVGLGAHRQIPSPTLPPDVERPPWIFEVQLALSHLEHRRLLAVPVDPRVIVVPEDGWPANNAHFIREYDMGFPPSLLNGHRDQTQATFLQVQSRIIPRRAICG